MKICAILLAAIAMSGCATIIEGTSQQVAVASSPNGARCDLTDGTTHVATIESTPQSVLIRKTKDDLLLNCALPGYAPASQYLHSGISSGVLGNAIAGGLIGWGVDSATGADNEYPPSVFIQFYQTPQPIVAVPAFSASPQITVAPRTLRRACTPQEAAQKRAFVPFGDTPLPNCD